MSMTHFVQDFKKVVNGVLKVANGSASSHKVRCETVVRNSSLIKAVQDAPDNIRSAMPKSNDLGNLAERASMVPRGILQFLEVAPQYLRSSTGKYKTPEEISQDMFSQSGFSQEVWTIREEDLEDIYMKSLGVEVLRQNEDGEKYTSNIATAGENDSLQEPVSNNFGGPKAEATRIPDSIVESKFDKNLHKLDNSSNEQSASAIHQTRKQQEPSQLTNKNSNSRLTYSVRQQDTSQRNIKQVKPISKNKPTSQLSTTSKQRKVPASRIGRLVTFGGLAAGLGIGTITEITKRSLGLSEQKKSNALLDSSTFLNEANAERIVDTLCRVRGAALKIGQILSIQDNTMMNPQLQKIFERVRHSADFMPAWQMERMMVAEHGIEWKSKLLEFEDKPFAAASIGQVHLGKLHDGRPVAIKIQYPGVAQGIESDIDNLMSVLNVWNIIPEGIFIDKVVEVAKRELSWEVDYRREAQCAKRFRKLLDNHPDYYVPEVIDELSTQQIYTTELIEGLPVDRCEHLDQETRDRISFLMLDLFFRELFEFQFMQTDPNWSNFLYNTETKQVGLLDFGASREYRDEFVDNYMKILIGAANNDKEVVIKASRDIGFLTGYESKAMENAHVEAVMILGEALRIKDSKYDFGSQELSLKIQRLVPIMVKERLCPPPEEIYSLHRKLSGVFLLCSRLKGRVECTPIFENACNKYRLRRQKN